jgi:4-hydroxy-tetrahydrodipicolinate synthase
MAIDPRGIVPALVTPFNNDESLNLRALARLLEHVLDAGVHGVFVLGSQGEYFAIEPGEKKRVIEATLDAVAGRVPVYAGTGATTTREAVSLTKMAEDAGVDAVSVITPAFIVPSQDEMYEHYRAIAASTTLPVLLYGNPARTGNSLAVGLVARLASIDNIVGIKDSSGDLAMTAAYITATPPSFRVFAGRDTLVLGTLLYGGAGSVAATGNVAPRLLVDIYDSWQCGDIEAARTSQAQLARLRETFTLGTFPAVIKEALGMVGIDAGPCRRPVGDLSEQARERLRNVLESLNLIP